jgi:hypothetical protein
MSHVPYLCAIFESFHYADYQYYDLSPRERMAHPTTFFNNGANVQNQANTQHINAGRDVHFVFRYE